MGTAMGMRLCSGHVRERVSICIDFIVNINQKTLKQVPNVRVSLTAS